MRTVDVSIAGAVYAMPVNFAASMQISELVGDPFEISLSLSKGKLLTLAQMVTVITVGVRAAGCPLESDKIGDAVIEAGAQDYLMLASKYVVALVSGAPEIVVDSKKKRARTAD